MEHVDLIGPYRNSKIKQQPGRAIIGKNDGLPRTMMIEPTIGCFDIYEILMFNLDGIIVGNDEYIDKSSARVSQLFKNTLLCRYPRPHKVFV